MESLEEIKARAEAAVQGASVTIIANPSPANQPSLLLDHEHAPSIAQFLRDDPALRLDHCSNVTGVDWLDRVVKKTVKVKTLVEGVERKSKKRQEQKRSPGYLEAVYHLYSMAHQARPGDHPPAHGGSRRRRASAIAHAGLAQRRIPGARDFRSLRQWSSMVIRICGAS